MTPQDSIEQRALHRRRHLPFAIMSLQRFIRFAAMNFPPEGNTMEAQVNLTAWHDPSSPTLYMHSLEWTAGDGQRKVVENHNPDLLLWMALEVELDAQGFKPAPDWQTLLDQIADSESRSRGNR